MILLHEAPPPMLVSTLSSELAPEELDRFIVERLQEPQPLSNSDTQLPVLSNSATQNVPSRGAGGSKRSTPAAARRGVSSSGGTKQHGQRSQAKRPDSRSGSGAGHNLVRRSSPTHSSPTSGQQERTSPAAARPVTSMPQKREPRSSSMPRMPQAQTAESRAHDMLMAARAATTYDFP